MRCISNHWIFLRAAKWDRESCKLTTQVSLRRQYSTCRAENKAELCWVLSCCTPCCEAVIAGLCVAYVPHTQQPPTSPYFFRYPIAFITPVTARQYASGVLDHIKYAPEKLNPLKRTWLITVWLENVVMAELNRESPCHFLPNCGTVGLPYTCIWAIPFSSEYRVRNQSHNSFNAK
jgi:hypothetical protein